ncbi:peroxiredoxin [Streptomyces sp. QH1-20]|uniref:peroxiredoxin n=1 Tax=Streptomyces sp. QH1-20 TaxID=3240934 RepID=UPI003511A8DF
MDDGIAAHLPGRTLPALSFSGTDGSNIRLDTVSDGRWVLFLYPLTGGPAADIPEGWNEISGARGCSQEAVELPQQPRRAQGGRRRPYSRPVLGPSRLPAGARGPPAPALPDALRPRLTLADELKLPTFEANGQTLYRRLTLVLRGATIEHVFYPVFPPDTHADQVAQWFRNHSDA